MTHPFAASRHRSAGLVFAGALPFWLLLAASFGAGEPPTDAAATYGAVTIALLAGLRMGYVLKGKGALERRRTYLAAGLLAGAATIATQAPPAVGLSLTISCFFGQALWDVTSADNGKLPAQIATARLVFTALAVVPLIGMLGGIVYNRS
jgi:hypothetical protein